MSQSIAFVKSSFTPYTPSSWFLEELYRIGEGRLRIRWSERQQKWCLEEKNFRPLHSSYLPPLGMRVKIGDPKKQDYRWIENDSYVRVSSGYQLVGYYDPYVLRYPDWVLKDIAANDKRRHGGVKGIEKAIAEREAKEAAIKEKDASADRQAWARDLYESWTWKQGERAAVPSNYKQ